MDNLFRQTKLQFSGTGQDKKEKPGSEGDQRISPQKTQIFKDKKKDQNWFQKRFSRQMSQDYDSTNGDKQAIAVAAAAYAISTLKEPSVPDKKQTKEETRPPTATIKGKKKDATILIPEHEIMEVSDKPDSKVPITATTDTKTPEKALLHAPSFRKSPSVDKQLSGSSKKSSGSFKASSGTSKPDLPTSTIKPAWTPSSVDKQPSGSFNFGSATSKPNVPTTVKPAPQPAETKRQSSTRPGVGKSQADIWEEAELARIKEGYEKEKTTILSWEDKKKKKAKRQLDKAQGELDRKRGKAAEKFRSEMQHIDQVVSGARAKAEEKKRNNEFKVKEKANTIRKIGKVPNTCSFF